MLNYYKKKGVCMTIKEAKQSGSRTSVKCGNSTYSLSGTLIGYTGKAVFIQNGRNLHIFVEKNGVVVASGHNIALSGNEEVRMYGNLCGIKRNGWIHLYDETGKPAGSRQA